jgi:hypothetical protein
MFGAIAASPEFQPTNRKLQSEQNLPPALESKYREGYASCHFNASGLTVSNLVLDDGYLECDRDHCSGIIQNAGL